jgi:NTE family protein
MTDKFTGKIGLALGGGGSKGAFQAGALKYLARKGILESVSSVAGISVGSLNAMKVVDNDIDGLLNIWNTVTNSNIYTFSILNYLRFITGGKGLRSNKPLRKFVTKHVNWSDVYKTSKKLLLGATSLQTGEIIYASNKMDSSLDNSCFMGDPSILLEYLLASTAIPIAFPPSDIHNQQWVDGGVTNINPLNILIKDGCDTIILIATFPLTTDVSYKHKKYGNLLDIGWRSISILEDTIVRRDLKRLHEINAILDATNGDLGSDFPYHGKKKINVVVIEPLEDLGDVLNFKPKISKERMDMGEQAAVLALAGI